MSYDYKAYIGSFEDLADTLSKAPLKDQKDLAEDILNRLYEVGYEVTWSAPDLTAEKVETL